jgi:hypothetical protein
MTEDRRTTNLSRDCSEEKRIVNLRSGTSLAALTLESTNSLLAPLVTHFVVVLWL